MENFTLLRSNNRTNKTKRWLGLLTFCIMLLSGQLSFAQFQLINNVDSNPTGWTLSGFSRSNSSFTPACEQSYHYYRNFYSYNPSGTITSPNLTGASNGEEIAFSFSCKANEWSLEDGVDVDLIVEYSTDNSTWIQVGAPINISGIGTTEQWSLPCTTFSGTIPAGTVAAGSDFKFRIRGQWNSGDGRIGIDQISVIQQANTPPNCATSMLPANQATDVILNPTLSWSDGGGAPTSYDIYLGTSANPPFLANVTSTTYMPQAALAANTTYFWKVVPKNNIGDALGCIEQTFTTGTNLVYCTPSGASNNTDEIRNFTLNNLNNDSAASEGTAGYKDYTSSVAPAIILTDVPNVASLTSGSGFGNHGVAIWIDFNQNGTFDSSEMVAFLPSSIGANTTIDFPAFTLPSNLPLGTYRLRVQYHHNKSGDLLDPCVATSQYSETEDYAVTVLAPPACLPPVDILADSITSSSANINWTENGTANTWHIEYGISGFTQGDGTTVPNITSRPYNLTGLSANTQYDVYVRSVCGAGTLNPTISDWTGPYTFRTDCGVISVLPYNEDFDTYGTGSAAFPACWTRPVTYTSGSTWPSIVSLTGAPSSPNALKFQSLTTEATYAVSPSYAEDINNLRVTFMLRREGSNSGTIDVGVMSDANDINTFELVQTIDPATGWIEYTINLNQVNLSGSGNFIAFRHNSGASNWFYWMDDFKVELLPSCLEPTALTTTSIGSNTADIEWIAGGSETAWNISWGAPGYTPGDGDLGTDTASTASYQLAGLTPQTSYDVYVQADCGGDLSSWTGPLSFTTNCVVVSDFYEDFEATTGTNLPNCWSKVGTTGTVDTRASAKLSGARVLYVYNNVTVALPVVDNARSEERRVGK